MASPCDAGIAAVRQRWPDVVESFAQPQDAYDSMAQNVANHRTESTPYYGWMAAALRPYLGRRVLELGAGPGFLARHFTDIEFYLATETWPPFLAELQAIAAAARNIQVARMDVADLHDRQQELLSHQFTSVLGTNLLEHIKDDIAALAAMASVIPAGSRVVQLVPAYRRLYGEVDRSIGHYRRYERAEIGAKMQAAGLAVEKVRYFNAFGVAAWWLANSVLRVRNPTQGQFRLFNALVPMCRVIETHVPAIVGLSVIAVGRKH